MTMQQLAAIEQKLKEHIIQNQTDMETSNAAFTDVIDALNENTRKMNEVFDLYQSLSGILRVLSWAERAAVWIAKMATAAGILWMLWQFSVSVGMKAAADAIVSAAAKK